MSPLRKLVRKVPATSSSGVSGQMTVLVVDAM
jgi:hypothetical protein